MAGAGYTVLKRVSSFKIGAVGAAEGACTAVGSVREAEYGVDASENNATEADLFDSVVGTVLTGRVGALAVVADTISMENLANFMHGTIDSTSILFGSPDIASDSGEPDYFCAYIHGWEASGAPKVLHVKKMYAKPGTKAKLSKDQQILSATFVCVAKFDEATGEEIAALVSDPADSTAPTVVSWVTAGTPSSVAKTGIVTTALTFSEPVRTADVVAKAAVFNQTTGVAIAGTWSWDAATTVFTWTPAAAYGATVTVRQLVNAGVRDLAGNESAALSSTSFVTAS
jgi:hypothetical protein